MITSIKKIIFFNFLYYIFIASPLFADDNFKINYLKIDDGLEQAKESISIDGEKIEILIVRSDPKIRSIKILTPKSVSSRGNYSGFSISEFQEITKSIAVQSGGYLSSWQPPAPLGFVKINGKNVNRPHKSWLVDGIFCINKNEIYIGSYSDNFPEKYWSNCIQSGPVLMQKGEVIVTENESNKKLMNGKHTQSFICDTVDGKFMMVITSKIPLLKLLDILPSLLECSNTLRLTSGPSSGMTLKHDEEKIVSGSQEILLPNAIAVR